MSKSKKFAAFVLAGLAALLFNIALAADGWSVQTTNGVSTSFGLWQVSTTGGGQFSSLIRTNAKCQMDFANGSTSTLPSCSEFQSVRAFAILATFFAAIGALLILAEIINNDKCGKQTWCCLTLAWMCGLISWAIWIDWSINQNNGKGSDFHFCFGLSVAATVLSFVAKCLNMSCSNSLGASVPASAISASANP